MTKPRTKPYELVTGPPPAEPAPPEKKPIMSADVKIQHDELRITPPRRGPQAGEAAMSDGAFIENFATAEELARWRSEIQARRAKDAGTWIWQKCDRCGAVMKDRPGTEDGGPCPRCNLQRRAYLGHMRTMTAEETNTYLFELAKKERAATEQLRLRAFHAANAERGQKGLPPLSFEEFKAQAQREYQDMMRRHRELGKISRPFREKAR